LFERLTGTGTGFQVRGAHLKIYRRAEGGMNIFGVFRVKNHDFTPQNHIFSNFRGAPPPPPPPPPPCLTTLQNCQNTHTPPEEATLNL
jgi:hypothetical protein